MDNFLNSFVSTSWSDMNESANRSWVGSITSQTNSLLSNSIESFQGDGKNSSALPMIPSNYLMRNTSAEDISIAQEHASSMFSDGRLKYDIEKGLFLSGNHLQSSLGIEAAEGHFSLPNTVTFNSTRLPYGHELNSSLPRSALTISSSLDNSASEQLTFGQSIGEAHSISSVPTVWPSSFSDISSLSGQQNAENFIFQGMSNDADLLTKGTIETANLQLPSLSSGPQMPFNKANVMHADSQVEGVAIKNHLCPSSNTYQQMTESDAVGCNAAAKPRVRARRGQATDPHSIAERLRREKIADRMKNLQELVPNSNKTDKASMLDEIIDYVKFLQLQVKVLSMSRLGAAGAVAPLITDVQAEEGGNLHLSSISQGMDLLASQDNLSFEQEVVKLMETSVTTAMQYLQNKGLCLMPIALASAISSQKSPASPPDRTKTNGHCSGVLIKQEDIPKSMSNGR